MMGHARTSLARRGLAGITLSVRDVFALEGDAVFDRICVSFGLKTLDAAGLEAFARLLHRLLRPGGRVALVEIGVPSGKLLRWPYLFYLRHVIPLIGRLCLGNPDCYRSLAIYTESFSRRDRFHKNLAAAGLIAASRPLFFGCARLYTARKPQS
jgi:demethylmenaquinone methyltransferase/2-methoxy-6-polyprenyl-1,4-benzoquinol methylase